MEYIEKIRINSLVNSLGLVPPNAVEEADREYLSICYSDSGYGIVNSYGEILIPFEYDNITVTQLEDYYQTCKKGKLGFIHIEKTESEYRVVQKTDCEYDMIDFMNEYVVVLQNACMISENDYGMKCRLYLSYPNLLTEEYDDHDIFCGFSEVGIAALRSQGHEYLLDIKTGKNVMPEYQGYSIGAYDAAEGALVIQQVIGDNQRLVHIGYDGINTFEYDGDDACPVMLSTAEYEGAIGFVVENRGEHIILDDCLKPVSDKTFKVIGFKCSFTGFTQERERVTGEMGDLII